MMKKSLFMVIFMLASLCINAQSLTFSGIPLGGDIASFDYNLTSGGFIPNTGLNSQLAPGNRSYRGKYLGDKIQIAVYYDDHTAKVYGVKVLYDITDKGTSMETLSKVKKHLMKKLSGVRCEETRDENGNMQFVMKLSNGQIKGFIGQTNGGYSAYLMFRDSAHL